MTAISIAEEKLAVMEAEESDIQLKETTAPEIEKYIRTTYHLGHLSERIRRAVRIKA